MFLASLLAIFIDISPQTVSASNGDFGGGSGTIASPYLITADIHLQRLAANVNGGGVNGYLGEYFKLENDVDLTVVSQESLAGWLPIGTSAYPFRGTFLGNSNTVTGVQINRISSNVGLFGIISQEAAVKDLSVNGNIRGGMFTGGVVGYNNGHIENAVNLAEISTIAMASTGGITGYNTGTIVLSVNQGIVSATGFGAGGIAGTNEGNIFQSYNMGVISGNSNVGGIAGATTNDSEITECFNYANIIATGNNAGGIAGDNKGLIFNTYNRGSLVRDGLMSNYFGGIVGNNDGFGAARGTIRYSYNIGVLDEVSFIGNISGFNTGVIENTYYSTEINDIDATVGVAAINTFGLSNKQMLDIDTLTSSSKMLLLNSESKWSRRVASAEFVYYPELTVFTGIEDSINSVKYLRVEKSSSDIRLGEYEFTYSGDFHFKEFFIDEYKLREEFDYILLSDSIHTAGENGSSVVIEFINYYKGTATKNFTIAKRPITIAWSDEVFYYNGLAQYPTVDVESGRIGSENITFEYEFNSNINAGMHVVTVKLADTIVNNNYSFESHPHEYDIKKQPITITWSNETLIYNGQIQYHTVTVVTGRIGDETIIFSYEFVDDAVNAGPHTVSAKLADTDINANYAFATQAHLFFIEKKEVRAEWSTEPLVYNGVAQHPSVSLSGAVADENVVLVFSGWETNIHVGAGFIVTISLDETDINANYFLIGTLTHTYAIEQAVIVIEWDDTPLRYNGEPQRVSFKIVSGQVSGETVLFDFSDYSNNINAGADYALTISLANNEINNNYSFTSQNIQYAILRAQILVEWNGEELIYNGQIQRPTASMIGEVFDYGLTLIYSNFSGQYAGNDYTVDISINNPNYEITNLLTYNILPKTVTVVWSDEELRYDGYSKRPDYQVFGVISGETVVFILSDYSSNISPGAFQISMVSNNTNYIFDETATHQYLILRRIITIADVVTVSRIYDGTTTVELAGGVLQGVLGGDTVSFLLGNGELSDKNAALNKVVKTSILLQGMQAELYELIQPTITVNISRAVIDMSGIVFNSRTFAYDGHLKSIFISGNLPANVIVEYENNNLSVVGAHIIVARFIVLDAQNFEPVSNMSAMMYIVQSTYVFEGVLIEISDGYIQHGANFSVSSISSADLKNILSGVKLQAGFEIKLKSNDVQVQPSGVLQVSLSLPNNILKNKTLAVYYVDEKNNLHQIDFQVIDGKVVFYINHLSKFLVVTDINNSWITGIIIPVLLILLAIPVAVVIKKKKFATAEGNVIKGNMDVDIPYETEVEVLEAPVVEVFDDAINKNIKFTFDGVDCKNYEWFLCAIKFKDIEKQKQVCAGNEKIAELIEAAPRTVAYWKGKKIRTNKAEYNEFLDSVKGAVKASEEK